MTRDDILRMAREAGMTRIESMASRPAFIEVIDCTPERLERFAALVATAEREAICEVGTRLADDECDGHAAAALEGFIAAIRSRGTKA